MLTSLDLICDYTNVLLIFKNYITILYEMLVQFQSFDEKMQVKW